MARNFLLKEFKDSEFNDGGTFTIDNSREIVSQLL